MKLRLFLLLLVAVLAFSGGLLHAQEANPAACVEAYDAEADYFPEKVTPEHSTAWSVEYFGSYKVVSVLTPWPGSAPEDVFQYVLVQCGTPAPEGYDDALVIEIPAGDTIAMSTSYLPHLADLGQVEHLVGLDSLLYLNTPEVAEKAAAGELIEVGNGASVNVELVLDAEPDVVLTYGSGSPDSDAHPVLLEAGVPVVVAADFMEETPLGQAEWLKFIALFYNKEAEANALFDDRVAQYEALTELAADIPDEDRPLVLWNSYASFGEAWFIPGELSHAAQLIDDAGGQLVLGDDPQLAGITGALPYDFEVVYEAGLDADVWVPHLFGVNTLDDLLAQDSRYADFAPVTNGTVYNSSARVNANGGNDYYESGLANPHRILADLIYILHPDLLPEHELYYFVNLE